MDYYKTRALSQSEINLYLSTNPARYWRHSVFNPNREERSETSSMRLGRICHALFLEPDLAAAKIILSPFDSFRSKESKEWKETQDAAGMMVVTQSEQEQAYEVLGHLNKNERVQAIKKYGYAEQPLFQRVNSRGESVDVDESGIAVKAKPDWIFENGKSRFIVDYKTTQDASPEGFRRSFEKFGYHRQAAWYLKMMELCGKPCDGFMFIAQEVETPEAIAFYVADPDAVEVGWSECQHALGNIMSRLELSHWQAYQQHEVMLGLGDFYRTKWS